MNRPAIVLIDRATLDRGDIDLSPIAELGALTTFAATTAEEVAERIAGAHVVVTNKVPLGAVELAGASSLGLIAVAATGVNNVDVDAAKAAGVAVANVAGYSTAAVVQHTIGALLALALHLREYDQAARGGQWQAASQFNLLDWPIVEVAGKTLGIVGYGTIGRGVAHVARALGMKVLVAASRPRVAYPVGERLPLATVLATADVVTVHTALSRDTANLIDHEAIARMKPGAWLLNMARGGVVNEVAVADALRSAHLGGAAFDVLSQEPPAGGNPLLDADLPNLILTPHTAWASHEARQRLIAELAANIRAFLAGVARNRVI
ncbi:MAG: NAD(P)-dependent oxidoreductase [Nitrospirota bacterium]|jgi:glycerate dehydrogenase